MALSSIFQPVSPNGLASDVVVEVNSISEILQAYERYPVILFRGDTSLETLEKIASLFGGAKENPTFAEIRDIKPEISTLNNSIALSKGSHPPHTDGTFSKTLLTVFMLQCVSPDELGGGQGIFWSVEKMLSKMPADIEKFLFEQEVCYSRLRSDGKTYDEYVGPILFHYMGKPSIRWRYDSQVRPQLLPDASKEDHEKFASCTAWILNYLSTEAPVEVTYKVGDIAICNNLLAFHARRALKGDYRHFRRAWLKLV